MFVCILGVWSKWCFLVWGYTSSVKFYKVRGVMYFGHTPNTLEQHNNKYNKN